MPTQKPRIMLTIDDDMKRWLDDFRFNNRYGTMNAAIVELLKIAIATIDGRHDDDNKAKN